MRSIFVLLSALFLQVAAAQQVKVHFAAAAYPGVFSGNVVLFLSKSDKEPKNWLHWPCYRKTVRNVRPGTDVVFDGKALSFPLPLTAIERGEYFVQAVFDRDLGGRTIGESPGNLYSVSRKLSFGSDTNEVFTIVCDQVVPEKTFEETVFVKELKASSRLLSRFYGKPATIDAPVILPAEYWSQPWRRFPVLFTVAGFGSDYHHYSKTESSDTMPASPIDTVACIRIYLDGNCRLGHSVYANSDNNGPWGDAFVKEFLPALQQRFRCNGAFLMRGHSSGGWTVLWLQTHYPSVFAGINASAPDPVDFHRFVETNLYTDRFQVEDANALGVGTVQFSNDSLLQQRLRRRNIEEVIYRGEQSESFNAVFSGKSKDGSPEKLIDYRTGRIDRRVFEHWKRYDISRYLQANWNRLAPQLAGKIRISVGNEDNAFLNKSVELLEQTMKPLGAQIVFAYYPGNHFTVGTPQYKKDELIWLRDKYLEWQRLSGGGK